MTADYRPSITNAALDCPPLVFRPAASATLIRQALRLSDNLDRPMAAVDELAYVRVIDNPTNTALTANSWLKDLAGSNLAASTSTTNAPSADGYVQVEEERTGVYACNLSVSSGSTAVSITVQWVFVTSGPGSTVRRVEHVVHLVGAPVTTTALASVQTDTTAIIAALGLGTDAAVAAGVLGSVQAHIRQCLVNDLAAIAALGLYSDAAVASGVSGSAHAHIRDLQDKVGTPATALYGAITILKNAFVPLNGTLDGAFTHTTTVIQCSTLSGATDFYTGAFDITIVRSGGIIWTSPIASYDTANKRPTLKYAAPFTPVNGDAIYFTKSTRT